MFFNIAVIIINDERYFKSGFRQWDCTINNMRSFNADNADMIALHVHLLNILIANSDNPTPKYPAEDKNLKMPSIC